MARIVKFIMAAWLLAACDQVPATPTPTRALSGPTLAASAVVMPVAPTPAPFGLDTNVLTSAALPRDSELPPFAAGTRAPGQAGQPISITLPNGVQHVGLLYVPPASASALTPGALLLAQDAADFGDLPERLRDRGITALVTTVPEAATLDDFTALLASLGGASDPGHLAAVGIGLGADAAVRGCANTPPCDAVAVVGVTSAAVEAALAALAPRPLWREPEADPLAVPMAAAAAETLAAWLAAQLG